MKKITLFSFLLLLCVGEVFAWGFYAHRRINRMAVFTLPPEMVVFYKHNIQYITENAVNPDRRRYAVDGEAPRHYIDIDVYGDSAIYKMPRRWEDAVAKYSEDTLLAYGIAPWHIALMKQRLTAAFRAKDVKRILLLSADLGHYIGDGNVPLHTTHNYNGQETGQYGIHGFWESRLPELFAEDFDYFFEKADYVDAPLMRAWDNITHAHEALDSVLRFEKELTQQLGTDKKYNFETRGGITVKVYSKEFSTAYFKMLDGQVERQMRAAIKMVGDFWYTCWVDAGQPDLNELSGFSETELEEVRKQVEEWNSNKRIKSRPHDSYLQPKEDESKQLCSHHHAAPAILSKQEEE